MTWTSAQARWPRVLAAGAALVVGAALVPSAAAAAPPPTKHFRVTVGPQIEVRGSYRPIVGHFTSLVRDDIIWYGPGSTVDNIWVGVGGRQVFEKHRLVPQVDGRYQPLVGDFAGDGRDDIYWHDPTEPTDHLWITTGPHTFENVDVYGSGSPTVLRASPGSGSKDDLLWTNHGTDFLWRFADDGSGAVETSTALDLPDGTPLSGDFDGDGDPDVLIYRPGKAADPLLRRNGPEGTSFTTTDEVVNGSGYRPLIGHFGPAGDPTDDIAWFRPVRCCDTGSGFAAGSVWLGNADGTFTNVPGVVTRSGYPALRSVGSVDQIVSAAVLGRDATRFRPDDVDTLWQVGPSGPVRTRIDNLGASAATRLIAGHFLSTTRDDLLLYVPGGGHERLLS